MLTILNRIRVRAGDCRVSLASVILGFVVLMFLSPVQDLLLEIRGLGPIIGFSAIMLLFWTIPVHNAAYRAIDNIPRPVDASFARSAQAIDTYFPPVLGLSTLVIVLAATAATANSLDTVDGIEEVDAVVDVLRAIQICMAAACVVFIGYVAWRHRLVSLPSHSFVGNLLRALPPALGIFTLLLLILAIIAPSEFAWRFGREDLLPVILGGWVPAFSYLALLSYRTGWPLIALTFVGLVVVSIFSGRFHDVRTYESDRWQAVADGRPDARGRQIPIEPAIKGWMTANGCEGKPAACPPVVLVAAEGGASRSAFYTATILGALLDTTRANPDDYYDFGRAIFAMSGVSGGALGVTITRTALALSDERGKQGPPCRHSDPTWFGDAASAGRDPTQSWRACLQLLAAGDYLSPTILGLVFRDGLAFLLSAVTKVGDCRPGHPPRAGHRAAFQCDRSRRADAVRGSEGRARALPALRLSSRGGAAPLAAASLPQCGVGRDGQADHRGGPRHRRRFSCSRPLPGALSLLLQRVRAARLGRRFGSVPRLHDRLHLPGPG